MLKSVFQNKLSLKITAMLLLCLLIPFSFPAEGHAAEAFSIDYYKVEVHANTDNSFDFVETIKVDFSESRHGILRAIPKKGGAQRYVISDIQVDGDPFTLEQDALNTVIRIGDANQTFNGVKTYRISYTMTYNKDSDSSGDLVYLDLIGHMWDTVINNVSIDFYYPDSVKPDEYFIYSGLYGAKTDNNTTVTQSKDGMNIKTTSSLSNFEGITLYAKFPDNTFRDAKELPYPFVMENYNADVLVKRNKTQIVTETFDLTIKDSTTPSYYYLPLYNQENQKMNIIDAVFNGGKINLTDIEGVCAIPLSKNGSNKLVYTIQGDYTKNDLSLLFFSNYRDVPLNGAKIIIRSPAAAISYSTVVSVIKSDGKPETVQNSSGKTIQIDITKPLQTGYGIFIDLVYPEGSFHFVMSPFTVGVIVIAVLLLLLAILLYFKYGKDETVSPVIEFYPPDGLSSAAIGFLSKRSLDSIDITSMLLYWASHNHLHFTATSKDDFEVTFFSDLDEQHPQWEQNAFNKLKSLIEDAGGTLSKSTLQNEFYKIAEKIRPAVPLYFKNERSLDDKKSIRLSGLYSFLIALFTGIVIAVAAYSGLKDPMPALISGVVAGILSFVFYGMVLTLVNGWFKRSKFTNFGLVFLNFLVAVVYFTASLVFVYLVEAKIQPLSVIAAVLFSILAQPVAAMIIKRSEYGQRMLERVVGFREFLVVAEKERLEALLNDNPEYYYQILPFALVLGVSDIWENKFKGLQMVEPVWYTGTYPGYYFSYAALSTFAHTTSTSLSSYTAPPSARGTGGFGGGGGGFGGGGFSGGGGGGGGGSSW